MKIHVHIDRLVLDDVGVAREHGPVVSDAVERELARLMAGIPHANFACRAVSSVRAPEILHGAEDPAQITGARIAGSVHSAIVANGR